MIAIKENGEKARNGHKMKVISLEMISKFLANDAPANDVCRFFRKG